MMVFDYFYQCMDPTNFTMINIMYISISYNYYIILINVNGCTYLFNKIIFKFCTVRIRKN